jgi:hypothetical protein
LGSNTICWGENESERKVETGPGVKRGGEKRMVVVRKGDQNFQIRQTKKERRKKDTVSRGEMLEMGMVEMIGG